MLRRNIYSCLCSHFICKHKAYFIYYFIAKFMVKFGWLEEAQFTISNWTPLAHHLIKSCVILNGAWNYTCHEISCLRKLNEISCPENRLACHPLVYSAYFHNLIIFFDSKGFLLFIMLDFWPSKTYSSNNLIVDGWLKIYYA